MQGISQRLLVSALGAATLVLGATMAFGESVESLIRRYPYDPACSWGRIANGKGTILRCLTEKESVELAAATPPAQAAAPAAPGETPAPPAEEAPTKSGPLTVTVGPVVADKGELGVGRLALPKDRYAKCVEDHGGLKGDAGEVHVRFLVRSKGIAEGVSVQKRQNVSAEAARCMADIVDRRRVGVPDEPLVGATVIIKLAAP